MAIDRTTETISHFIGVFGLADEAGRLRDAFDPIRSTPPTNQATRLDAPPNVAFDTPHALGGFDPDLSYAAKATPINMAPSFWSAQWPALPHSSSHESQPLAPPLSGLDLAIRTETSLAPRATDSATGGQPKYIISPPNAVAVVTVQSNVLYDDDLILSGQNTAFVPPSQLLPILQDLAKAGEGFAAFAAPPLPAGSQFGDWAGQVADLMAAAEEPPGASVSVHRAEAVMDVTVDGEKADALPDLADLLPALNGGEAADGDEAQDAGNAHDFSRDFGTGAAPAAQEGHQIVTGANTLINEAQITLGWVDAPVIAVKGNVTKLESVSQTNILVDRDSAVRTPDTPSVAKNAASITATSSGPAFADSDVLPANWAVVKISGDLIATNYVKQFNFVSDMDRAEISITGASTYVGLGDNAASNLAQIAEFGPAYDLIFVGGNMIDVTTITQTNVLFDNDTVFGAATEGDNLLFNRAELHKTGIDSYTTMSDAFRDQMDALAKGLETMGAAIAENALFKGAELLRVLSIEGDLTKINVIEQTNILGDADQVSLAQQAMEAATGLAATVVSGSNALANLAALSDRGVDSTVLAGGDVYSDALLYQAELIDQDVAPTGVALPALASEAVAFLADGMIGPDPADWAPSSHVEEYQTDHGDIMQTVLS